jgi:hypothetical protein
MEPSHVARANAIDIIGDTIDNCGPHAETVARLLCDLGSGLYYAAEEGRLPDAMGALERFADELHDGTSPVSRALLNLSDFEDLRSDLAQLEALAHAASETLRLLPHVGFPVGAEGEDTERRLNHGRLVCLVFAIRDAAREAVLQAGRALARAAQSVSNTPPPAGQNLTGRTGRGESAGHEDETMDRTSLRSVPASACL